MIRICMVVCIAMMFSAPVLAEEWVQKAADKIKEALKDDSTREELAKSILKNTHPTGSSPKITATARKKDADDPTTLESTFTVSWQGGPKKYTMVVTWKCNLAKHLSAKVTYDDSPTAVSDEDKPKLEKQFSDWYDKLFPKK